MFSFCVWCGVCFISGSLCLVGWPFGRIGLYMCMSTINRWGVSSFALLGAQPLGGATGPVGRKVARIRTADPADGMVILRPQGLSDLDPAMGQPVRCSPPLRSPEPPHMAGSAMRPPEGHCWHPCRRLLEGHASVHISSPLGHVRTCVTTRKANLLRIKMRSVTPPTTAEWPSVAWRCSHPSPDLSAEHGSQLDLTGPLTPLFGSGWGELASFPVGSVFRACFAQGSAPFPVWVTERRHTDD
jgi:hypothetical protein